MKINEAGFSVLEVILAAAIFVTFATAAVVVVISGIDNNRLGGEMTVANQFNTEGMEAVRSIKNQSWTTFANQAGAGNTGVSNASGTWAFNGLSDNTLPSDTRFKRAINIANVQRDVSGNIVASGTNDPDTKKVTATTTWNFTSARPEEVTFTEYFTNWEARVGGPIMMAYSKNTSTPFYRIWDGSAWGTEAGAQSIPGGGNINYVVLKSARTKTEAVLGTLDANGNIYAQVWNGISWGHQQLMVNLGSANSTTRSFDIAYEKNSDRLIIVYPSGTGNIDFACRIWDGSTWSSPIVITAPPTTAIVRWIELAQNPLSTSNDVAMIMMDNNRGVYGMIWNGATWVNMGVASVWDTASIATRKAVDVAYEQSSGRAMFIWGDTVATDQYYRIWNGTTLTPATLLDIPAAGNVVNWIKLVSRPNSNELMYGEVDAAFDLNTRKWSGSAWDTATQHAEHANNVENITSMVFDLVWETYVSNPGKAWLLMGNSNVVEKKQWSGTAWGTASTLTGSDDTSFIRLKVDPVSGAIFGGFYESQSSSNDDIWESHLTDGGATWSARNVIWGGQVSAEPVYFRVDIATP